MTGYFFTPNGTAIHAFLYSNGQMMDLNGLIDPALHVTLDDARAINDNGQIVASNGSNGHDYLLTPVPEPGTWALLCVSGLMLAARRQHSLVCSRLGLLIHSQNATIEARKTRRCSNRDWRSRSLPEAASNTLERERNH